MMNPRGIRWERYEARMGAKRNVYSALMGETEGKRSLERSRRRREDYIKMDLRAVG
jgi:hypothetical protein